VTCIDNHVAQIRLELNNLVGTVPASISNLSFLWYLNLQSNKLTESIPTQVGTLSNLQFLTLAWNQLTGNIPPQLGNLVNLQVLWLHGNQLTGDIPQELGNLANLQLLYLHSNQLTGGVPIAIGKLTNLQYLDLSDNKLTGSIPSELGNLKNLQQLILSSNQLTGNIPSQLGSLTILLYLYLDDNQLSGSIPGQLGNLTNLQVLAVDHNQLTGTIPASLGNLTNLQVLHIGHNQLTGSIPAWLGNLPNLQSLHLGHNQLTGSIPTELGNLANLQTLHLGNNSLTGSVPSELGNLTKLQDLHLLSNQLTGAIPVSLTNLTSLVNGGSELGWNALYTTDNTLRAFLNQKQAGGNWESTQTVAPTNLTATPLSSTSVQLIWTPIVYTGDTGGYEIWKGTPGGTLWILEDTTSNKSANTYTVNNLTPDTPYAFKLRTVTNPHANNQNTVYGEYTAPTSTGDGFDANLIDRTVWTDLEFVRRINNGVFESALTRYGSNGSNYLVFSNSGSVNSFSADVTVTAYQNNGSYPHASLLGFVYNDGTPGDGHTGDVLGIVGIGHNGSLNRLEGFYTISRCTAANCNLPDEYDQICTGLVDPSFSPSLNTAYTLSFSWDGASSITFGIDDKVHPKYTKVINSSNCSGLPSSHGAPRVQMKGISTRIAQINGSNDGGYIAATFDNVHVNGGPYDNFESSPINKIEPALWTNFEFVRAASGGELVSELTQRGVNGTNNTSFVDSQHILGFEADLKVLDFQFNAGFPVRPLGRLYAALYNDGTGNSTPGDLKGDVIASVGILDNGQGLGPQAFYSVSHCLAANCNLPDEYEILYSNFFKNVGLDETHTFSIAWDGLNVAVGCDGNVVSYNPTSLLPVGGPAKGRKGIGTRVTEISNTTEWAYVAASFDNVVITQTDTNLDGMADSWEMANFGTLAVNPNGDPDHDGLTNLQEYQYGTNPNQANGPYTISATAGAGGGITPSGAVTVNYRANQTFNIALNSGYHIEDVLVDGVSQGAITSYTFTNVTAGHSISVAFASDTFTITASAGLNGSIAPSGAVSVNYGSDQTFTIAPDPGYHVESVSVDGGALTPPPTTYTFTNVSANHTISATFSINATISSINPDHGTIADNSLNFTLYGTGFNEGTTVQLTNFVLIDPTLPNPGSIDATVDTVGGTSITGRFDLTKAGIGQYDVVVTNPDGQSAILSKGFTVLDTNPPVTTAIPRGATYNASLSVTLLTNEPATIYYTTNGTEPTLDSASYTNPIPISATTTLKFFAIDAESKREATKTEIYTMDTRFGAIAVLDPQTPELIIPVTSIFTFPSGTRAIVVDCHKVNHTLRDSEGNVLPMTDYLKHYVIGPPDTPGSDVKTYSGDVPVTCDLAQLYPPEALLAGNYTLEVNYSNFFQPPGIHLFQGSISAAPIPVHVAALITTHIVMAEAGPGGSILLSDSVVSGPVLVRHGSSPTFAIARNPGYQVQDVLVDGVSQGAITSYTFTNVTADHTISATFSINPLTISSITPNYGTIADNSQSFTLSGAGFNAETTVQLTNFVLIDPSLPNPGSIDATVGTVGGTSITGQFDLTKAGIGQYDVVVTNPDGQSAILTKGFTVLDTLAPVTTAFPRGAIYNAPLSVTLLTNEPATIYYSIGGAFVEYTAPINISSNTTLQFYAIDAAGNGEATKTETYTMDARFGAIAVLDSPTPELIIPVTSTFTFPSAGTQAIVVDCHKVNHTLRDSNGNVLPITDYLKHYVIGDPDTPGSDVITYSGDVSITCDLAKLYPPEVLFAGDYTLEVNYSNFFQPPGIQLFQGSISAVPILVHVAEAITTHIITTEAGAGGSILLSGSAVSGPVVVRRGSSPTFTITPNQGYQIDDVKVDNVSQGRISSYTFSDVRADHTISATFAINTFTITASAGAGGSITPSGTVIVNYGDSKAFTIAPNPGYHIVNVMVDNVSKGAISSYTFSDVRAGHTISATFASNTYTITATAGANGSITPSGTVTVNYGANKTFTIKPNTSYHVADVLVDGVSVDAVTTYTFKGVSANHTISATFAINTYVLTVTKAGTGSGNVTASIGTLVWNGNVGTATYPAGTKVTLTATANEGSTFTGWSASCSGTGSCSTVIIGSKVTMNMCGPCKATATFRKK
jgi:Leucine-rich repeat (LRR) protein